MQIHITQVTKQFLDPKTYKSVDRGVIDIPPKACLKTFFVIGKYDKFGILEKISQVQHEINKVSKFEYFKIL